MSAQPSIKMLLKKAYAGWKEDRGSNLAAALTYHAIFSITPLLLVVLALVGALYQDSSTELLQQIRVFVGKDATELIQSMLEGGKVASQSGPAFLIGSLLTIVGSIGVFKQLKIALDIIWEIPPRKIPWREIVKRYAGLFLLVIFTSFFFILSLSISTLLSSTPTYLLDMIRGSTTLYAILTQLISLGVSTLLFGILFKTLPDTHIPWKNVWRGAIFTSLVLAIEKYVFGFYLSHSSVQSAYGAAGSLVALLLWIYYSAQVFLFGAEIVNAEQRFVKRESCSVNPWSLLSSPLLSSPLLS
nr:YihY/virulence factor BrkB family protein [Patescibacteria group bacterium]